MVSYSCALDMSLTPWLSRPARRARDLASLPWLRGHVRAMLLVDGRLQESSQAPRSPAKGRAPSRARIDRNYPTGADRAGDPASTKVTSGFASSGEDVLNPLTMR